MGLKRESDLDVLDGRRDQVLAYPLVGREDQQVCLEVWEDCLFRVLQAVTVCLDYARCSLWWFSLFVVFGAGESGCYFFFPLLAAWVSADAATLFWGGVDFGLLRIFDALDATDADVFSFLAMMVYWLYADVSFQNCLN